MSELIISVETLKIRNPLIELWDLLRAIIHSEVIDPNTERANDSNPLARKWVFPDTPENNDEKFPRVAVKFTTFNSEIYSADDFVSEETDDEGNIKGIMKGRILKIPVIIGAFVKKQQGFNLELPNNNIKFMKDTLLGDHLAWSIKQAILKNRYKLIEKRFDIDGDVEVSPSYEDNSFLFASDIQFTISTLDIWNIPVSDGSIISEFELAMEAEYDE